MKDLINLMLFSNRRRRNTSRKTIGQKSAAEAGWHRILEGYEGLKSEPSPVFQRKLRLPLLSEEQSQQPEIMGQHSAEEYIV